MSDTNPAPGGFGPPSQPPQQPAPGYGYPQQSGPGYGYPQTGPSYPAAPPVGYPQAPGYGVPAQPRNGMGTSGLVLGIIGVVCSLTFILWFFGVILGILAIIFGAVGRGRANRGEANNKGAATAGLVCGIVATVILPLLGLLLFASIMGGIGAS
ncbi:DUF4190 domain-containing protein [Streptomyces spinosirectus]|jgi:hypothetical protein|uniref:DUF4190 domain-containing protein n=1 Tax=Streptomyces TaxID=1883 RepID=UPI000D3506FC|nr:MULTISPECIES: DUF4190 domain-containing protein [Streptomyces]MBY8344977.1 DUF4190 domain-containing protein [Streptomyces plumbidurans]PTM86300.1 hypothetical protein C7821_118138 [Streptomyces sp. VMFN-G11Ma]UIR20768.1 DUF4190 domain-containing protein [Streptomyces spinosirectus]